jgi:tetratricopeptide (TPR) repeat protein
MKFLTLLFALLALSCFAFADEGQHHEELTAQQLGTVHFPVSCSASVKETFGRGVALLHSFWYEEAEKTFQQVAKDDPRCAMAHWGVAMSLWHQLWNRPDAATLQRGAAEIKQAKALHAPTDRERGYIAALGEFYAKPGKRDHQKRTYAYSKAMERLHLRYPDDHEAGAFYGLSVIASDSDNYPDSAARKKDAIAVLEKLFGEEPDHPGAAHYLIHIYDTPEMAAQGLPAARRYAQVAPVAPHALHMPSHIFARLGLWQDDINSNLASIAATHESSAMHMGGEGHQFHAMDFLVYAYLQSGHEHEAERVIEEVKAMPPMKDMYGEGFDPHIAALVWFGASHALELHHWAEAAALQPVPTAGLADGAITYRARAIGAVRSGDLAGARKDLAELERIHEQLVVEKQTSRANAVDEDRRIAQAWIDYGEGRNDSAIKALSALGDKEDGVHEASDGIPVHEMLGDMLLEMNRPEQALTEYETDLKMNPNRFDALAGAAQAAEKAGKTHKANSYYATLVEICAGSGSERPELAQAKALRAKK